MDLTVFSSLTRLKTISNKKNRDTEKEIAKKYLSHSESYRLNAIYMNFVTLYTLLGVISSAISFLCLGFALMFVASLVFLGLTIVLGAFAVLIYLGGRYRYFGVIPLEKFSWRLTELAIPNFAGGAERDRETSRLIEENADIKDYLEELEDNKRIRRLLRYSRFAIFP